MEPPRDLDGNISLKESSITLSHDKSFLIAIEEELNFIFRYL